MLPRLSTYLHTYVCFVRCTGTTSKLAALKKIEMKLPLPSKESTNQENKDGSKSKHVSRTVVASSTKHGKGLTKAQVKKALETPGIVPPRREIGMLIFLCSCW